MRRREFLLLLGGGGACSISADRRAFSQQLADNPTRANRFAADSVDVVERGHDMSCTLDPGYGSGARYGRTAKHRSRHQVF